MDYSIGIIGGGSWGTAIGAQIAQACAKAQIYVRNQNIAEEINDKHTNTKYLPNTILSKHLIATSAIEDICQHDIIIVAVPSNQFIEIIETIKPLLNNNHYVIVATKGIINYNQQFFTQYIAHNTRCKNAGALIGPNFAEEVANNKLSFATLAFKDLSIAEQLSTLLSSKTFIFKPTNIPEILQLAGTIKNIIAISVGISRCLGNGQNHQSYLIAEGLKEILTLSKKLSPDINPIDNGWVGDLILTCTSMKSRNTQFGFELAKSTKPRSFLATYPLLVEGYNALDGIYKLSNKFNLALPIIDNLYEAIDILKTKETINDADRKQIFDSLTYDI